MSNPEFLARVYSIEPSVKRNGIQFYRVHLVILDSNIGAFASCTQTECIDFDLKKGQLLNIQAPDSQALNTTKWKILNIQQVELSDSVTQQNHQPRITSCL